MSQHIDTIRQILAAEANLEFAVLIGSRVDQTHTPNSDWDIALQWQRDMNWLEQLSRTETLRHNLANALALPAGAIDLIDTPRASLAMRAEIAENGMALLGEDELPWQRFLRRTWREQEDHYCRSRKKPRERRFELRNLLNSQRATSGFLTFHESIIIGGKSMRTDLYHAETKRIASQQGALLDEARSRLLALQPLSPLEQQNLVLHGLQVLIENAIGKAKQQLKARGEEVPISAYDAFAALALIGTHSSGSTL